MLNLTACQLYCTAACVGKLVQTLSLSAHLQLDNCSMQGADVHLLVIVCLSIWGCDGGS